ncbi:hypothetical protein A3G48_04055 [Candidatus Nomurabacteria bacterium RIFCSPLOWO2_12_FULL_40_42]|uniref:Uncharacterized protein n=1 Tax=Candidatus Nomurabacteria bacterium RIFCSPLOWO2_02_FULL_40_67 TaxID=1801787 RepID=A0A1F6Y5Y9_9BACT|nr:MAG: hypothetical protein UU01_C0008G0002 [Parcubacteria group bacterium GW2011_GWA2_40_37]KKS11277.1 MAG: hypothetical protein UU66_C0022G0006 [Parcubacteria group bacterium GW2011_GWB1_41_5]OGI63225.1 MAG: hypothetical protein A2W12_00760 [Candidatus Nomurabacteria bacterium RBG_16_40_11]OGI73550.1 MAG: hypothetical protein A2W56_01640 [Candidatus Nomurabacteria bacterium RIFCSPHIGHO2_02_41_18]OGI78209.1 MAG: hypothetical protein A3C65_00400 [Candidatus Nomurabacteria bacterium RIFCSPHIGHO
MYEWLPSTISTDHKKIITIFFGVIVILVVLGTVYFRTTSVQKSIPVPIDPIAVKQSLLSFSSHNPPADLTSWDISTKQAQMKLPNPTANLSPKETEAKRSVLENI